MTEGTSTRDHLPSPAQIAEKALREAGIEGGLYIRVETEHATEYRVNGVSEPCFVSESESPGALGSGSFGPRGLTSADIDRIADAVERRIKDRRRHEALKMGNLWLDILNR